MGGSDNRVWWRGVQLDARSAAMMDEVVRLCPGIDVQPSQGSWSGSVSASAGTHAGAGAIDVKAEHLAPAQRSTVRDAMRRVGWAAWIRSPAQGDWPWHVHGIAVDCPGLSRGAAAQVTQYMRGTNGLANHGPDDGPRDHVGVTWETYQGGDDMTPEQAHSLAECRRMLAVLLAAQSPAPGEHGIATQTRADEISENAREARRLGAVLLDASPPVGNERTIPAQLNG